MAQFGFKGHFVIDIVLLLDTHCVLFMVLDLNGGKCKWHEIVWTTDWKSVKVRANFRAKFVKE